MKDKKKNKKDKKWNRDDLDFDSAGRLVIKNKALARRFEQLISRDAGLIVSIPNTTRSSMGDPNNEIRDAYRSDSDHTIVVPDMRCHYRLIDPPLNKAGCVDGQCGAIATLRLIEWGAMFGATGSDSAAPPDQQTNLEGEDRG